MASTALVGGTGLAVRWGLPEVDVQRRGRIAKSLALGLATVALAGCSGKSGVHLESVPSTEATTAVPSPASTIPAAAQAAVATYSAYIRAADNAETHPTRKGHPFAAGSDFTKYSFAPISVQTQTYIWAMALDGSYFRGKAGQPRIRVKAVDMKAEGGPVVTLNDCETKSYRRQYNAGKLVEDVEPKVPLPHLATVTVSYAKNRWGVERISFDSSQTCTM